MAVPEDVPFPLDAPIPPTFNEALAGMVDREFLGSQRFQEQQWRADRTGAHPDILEFVRLMVRRMERLGVPIFASEIVRSPQRQNDLYALGNSRARAGQSAHQYGCAVDLVHGVKGWSLSRKQWEIIVHVGKEVAAQKGLAITSLALGSDSFYDPAHWQVENWKQLKGDYPWKPLKLSPRPQS